MLILIVYLIGVVVAYLGHRWAWEYMFGEFDEEDKKSRNRLCFGSWISVVCLIGITIIDGKKEPDKW